MGDWRRMLLLGCFVLTSNPFSKFSRGISRAKPAARAHGLSETEFRHAMDSANRVEKLGSHFFTKHPVHPVNPVSDFFRGLLYGTQ